MNSARRQIGRKSVIAVFCVLTIGTVFYRFVEDFTWLDAFYFSVSTFATVGYGDFVPASAIGKIFTSFYMLTGVAILTGYLTLKLEGRQQEPKNSSNKSEPSTPKY